MLDWFRALLPKEERFFGLFEQHAALVVAGAESQRAALEGGSALPQHLQAVVERENEADAITREVLLAVRRSFITPFDRRFRPMRSTLLGQPALPPGADQIQTGIPTGASDAN